MMLKSACVPTTIIACSILRSGAAIAGSTALRQRRECATSSTHDQERQMRGGGTEQLLSPEQEAERREMDAQGIPLDKRPGARAEDFVPPLDISDEAKRAQPPRDLKESLKHAVKKVVKESVDTLAHGVNHAGQPQVEEKLRKPWRPPGAACRGRALRGLDS